MWRRRIAPWTGIALAAVAAVVLFVVIYKVVEDKTPKVVEGKTPNVFAEAKTRPHDVRFAYSDAGSYRPLRDQMRGAGGPSGQAISYSALAELERRGDKHALAIAKVWNGEKLTDVAEQLHGLGSSPSVRSDRAAIDVLTTSNDNVESVLTELEALRASHDPAAARAARWNYAILLAQLDLPLSAAQAFRAIADEHEAGWADEASSRAAALEARARSTREPWDRAKKAGAALVATGALVPIDLVRAVPSTTRLHFYDAVRTAPSRDRVLALAPMAAELDRLGNQPILSDYVRRVASFDFQRRAPLAAAYAQLVAGTQPSAAVKALLTDPTAPAEVVDIVMGAMANLNVVADHLEAYRRMVKQTRDPWFEIALAQQEKAADWRRGDWFRAEARLRDAQKLFCSDPTITYQCMDLADQLGELLEYRHRIPEAVAVVHAALPIARGSAEWSDYRALVWRLADIGRFNSSPATARVYAGEVLLMAPDECRVKSSAYRTLAGAALLDADGPAARRHLDAALLCGAHDLPAANYLTDIARLDPQPGDLARLQDWLGKLRANGQLTAGQRVFADEIEGRLVVESDRAAGTALLERAIAAAGTQDDVTATKARAGAYSVLVFAAARHGELAQVVGLIARELGLPRPDTCMAGIVAEDERAVVVVRGANGEDHGEYSPTGHPRDAALVVSPELAKRLEGCAHVQVMAQAALQGQPRVLPATLSWSYATGARRDVVPQGHEMGEAHTLIITDVTPPAELQLPTLLPRAPDPTPSTRTLSGTAATPTQVLAAMGNASEIQFHTHALMDMGVSDASHLVLSPGPDGRYALTAEAIRGVELRGRPIIVLAACHSAQGARYQHAPWSLPHAFLTAGARAVVAAGTAIPDPEAGPFFDRVLARVRAGEDPAAALRDERIATLTANPSSWVADVIVFE
jgi:hypothetical protein